MLYILYIHLFDTVTQTKYVLHLRDMSQTKTNLKTASSESLFNWNVGETPFWSFPNKFNKVKVRVSYYRRNEETKHEI